MIQFSTGNPPSTLLKVMEEKREVDLGWTEVAFAFELLVAFHYAELLQILLSVKVKVCSIWAGESCRWSGSMCGKRG
jgi:hypothetical protein